MIRKNYSKFEVKEEFKTLSFNNVLLYREDTKMYQVIFLSLLNQKKYELTLITLLFLIQLTEIITIFAAVILAESPRLGLRWGYIYINKGVTDALVLTYLNLASSYVCQKQSNGDALWGVLYVVLNGFGHFCVRW